jgi:hypothetical protein
VAYTDFADKVILKASGLARITLGAACRVGDLISRDGTLADANANKPALYVAMRSGASGAEIPVARHALCGKKSTIAAGGIVTAGTHSGAADDVLWLSATGGRPSATPVATIGQEVGWVLDTERFVLEPSLEYDANIELVAADKTLDEQDCGKQMYVTADALTVTLPATATGLNFVVVNGMNDGDSLVLVSPNSSDLITGPDYAGTDNKDWQNTKATARAGDRLEFMYKAATGWIVTKVVGTWAQES